MKNSATAIWKGTGQDGQGSISTKSKVLSNVSYSYKTRFEDAPGTNPEELIAAAHAACFAMKSAFVFNAAGYNPEQLSVSCEIRFEGGKIVSSTLKLEAKIKDIKADEFDELVSDAGHNCPVSQLLNTTLNVEAKLV